MEEEKGSTSRSPSGSVTLAFVPTNHDICDSLTPLPDDWGMGEMEGIGAGACIIVAESSLCTTFA